MFFSKYLPVNIKRKNAAVFTKWCIYPADLLVMAKAALADKVGLNTDVVLEDGMITFPQHPEIKWSLPEVYLAYEAYETAVENNFSFYVVNNKDSIPQLLVSKPFKNHRLLVNAMTFESIIVTKPNLVKRISAMIDCKYESRYCMDVFEVIERIEAGSPNFLDAIICERDTEEENMVVNPVTTLYADDNIYYDKAFIEDCRTLLHDPTAVVETAELSGNAFQHKGLKGFASLSTPFVKSLVELYDRITAKKCNYLYLTGDDCDTHYYVSTNWRYLVNARTLECVVVQNVNLKKLLQSYVAKGNVPVADLTLCWMIATKEPT